MQLEKYLQVFKESLKQKLRPSCEGEACPGIYQHKAAPPLFYSFVNCMCEDRGKRGGGKPKSSKNELWTVLHLNCRGYQSKRISFESILGSFDPQIMILFCFFGLI